MKNNGMEIRYMPFSPTLEVRENSEGKKVIRGYALKFNTPSEVMVDWLTDKKFTEVISERALDQTDMTDVFATFNHNFSNFLGRNKSGTLILQRDETGLFYEVTPPKSGKGQEAVELAERGEFMGSSFMFMLGKDGDDWEKKSDGTYIRTLTNISVIRELGPVFNPAYLDTSAEAAKRSYDEFTQAQKPPEKYTQRNLLRTRLELIKRKH